MEHIATILLVVAVSILTVLPLGALMTETNESHRHQGLSLSNGRNHCYYCGNKIPFDTVQFYSDSGSYFHTRCADKLELIPEPLNRNYYWIVIPLWFLAFAVLMYAISVVK
jgi:hypothetical protein